MTEESIAIVGGGVAGLSAAYYLSKSDFGITLFEKDPILGGRAPRANQIVTESYTELLNLLEELSIKDYVLNEIEEDDMKSYSGGKIRGFGPFSLLLKHEENLSWAEKHLKKPFFGKMMGIDIQELERLKEDVESIDFRYEDTSERADELRRMSMQEWIDQYEESIQEKVIYPVMLTTFINDMERMNAEEGVFHVKDFLDGANGKMWDVAGGPLAITREIKDEVSGEFNMLSEVVDIEEKEESIVITYERNDKREKEEFDCVVMAIPLDVVGDLLDEDFGVRYSFTNALTVDGDLKSSCATLLGADRDVNLRLIFAEDDEHYVYAENITKPLDMDMFYEDYEVLGGEKTKAHPILSPGQEVPGMKYSDRIFLAGDFYHFSGLNTSVYTGKKVGEEISKCYTEG